MMCILGEANFSTVLLRYLKFISKIHGEMEPVKLTKIKHAQMYPACSKVAIMNVHEAVLLTVDSQSPILVLNYIHIIHNVHIRNERRLHAQNSSSADPRCVYQVRHQKTQLSGIYLLNQGLCLPCTLHFTPLNGVKVL